MAVKFKVEKDGETLKCEADIILAAAIEGDETGVIVVGEQSNRRIVEGLAHLVVDMANTTGKGFEFVTLVSSVATDFLMKGEVEGDE